MEQLTFESRPGVTQKVFRKFAEARERLGDHYHYELLNGRIVMNPLAGFPHGQIDSNVSMLLNVHVKQYRLGRVFGSSQGFELPSGDTVQPDCTFVSLQRWNAAPPPRPRSFPRVVPDLVVEIFSESTGKSDREEKRLIYEKNGVREYWIVDWRGEDLTVFLLKKKRFAAPLILTHESRYTAHVLPRLSFRVSELFE